MYELYKGKTLLDVFEYKKFVVNAQQCFACTPQANFPAHNFNEDEGDEIESRLPFKIFSTLITLLQYALQVWSY